MSENHIADQHADNRGKAWCGATLFGWSFISIDHAAINARNAGNPIACPDCVRAIVAVFEKHGMAV